ncbi:hypothetical protein KC19_VG013500 [Ceratodon purpureus]|uniref:Uncharacterized protein n=1 Tax=Ceratodon purpureus TaxID=3225 RepID=A0A8T0HL08_CERPU|nr:hypothetical protein KC19_VG013500 [Ceratodon purpureus]
MESEQMRFSLSTECLQVGLQLNNMERYHWRLAFGNSQQPEYCCCRKLVDLSWSHKPLTCSADDPYAMQLAQSLVNNSVQVPTPTLHLPYQVLVILSQ